MLGLSLVLGLAAAATAPSPEVPDPRPDDLVEAAAPRAFAGDHQGALVLLEGALEVAPDHRGARLLQARVLAWSGRHRDAAEAWKAAVLADPDDPEAWAGQGSLALAVGRPDAAAASFDEALRLDPAHTEATAGMETARDLRRSEVRGGIEAWAAPSGTVGAGARLSLSHRPRSRLALRAGGGWGAGLDRDLSPSAGVGRLEAEAALTVRGGSTLTAGVQGSTAPWGGLRLGLSQPVGPTRMLVGWRPGVAPDGVDHLFSVGLGADLWPRTWVQGQLFSWRGPDGAEATSGVLTLGWTGDRDALRLDAGAVQDESGWLAVGGLSWDHALGAHHGLVLETGLLAGRFTQVRAGATLRVAFR